MDNILSEDLIQFIQCNHCSQQLVDPVVSSCCNKLYCNQCINSSVICPNCSSETINFQKEPIIAQFLNKHTTPTIEDLSVFSDCALCYNLPSNPLITSCCRKVFCTMCLKQWVSDHNDCPMCRQQFKDVKFHNLDTTISEHTIYYFETLKHFLHDIPKFCKFDCGSIVQMSKIQSHMDQCPKVFANHRKSLLSQTSDILAKYQICFKSDETLHNFVESENLSTSDKQFYQTLLKLESFYSHENYQQFNALIKIYQPFDNPSTLMTKELEHIFIQKTIKSLFKTSKYSEVASFCSKIVTHFYDPKINFLHAKSLYKCDHFSKARTLLEESIELKTQYTNQSRIILGNLYSKFGPVFYPKSLKCYTDAINHLKLTNEHDLLAKALYRLLKVAISIDDISTVQKVTNILETTDDSLKKSRSYLKAMIIYYNSVQDFSKSLALFKNENIIMAPHQKVYYQALASFKMIQGHQFVGDKLNLIQEQLQLLKDQYFDTFYHTNQGEKTKKITQLYTELSFYLNKNQNDTSNNHRLISSSFLCHQTLEFLSKRVGVNLDTIKLLNLMAKIWLNTPLFNVSHFQQTHIINVMTIYIETSLNNLSELFKDVEDLNLIEIVIETKYLTATVFQYVATIRSDFNLLQKAQQIFNECKDYFILYDLQKYEDVLSKIMMCDPTLYGMMVQDDDGVESDSDY